MFTSSWSTHESSQQQQQNNEDMYPVEDANSSAPAVPNTSALPTRLRNLTSGFAAPVIKLTNQKRCSMPTSYVPGDRDVICGRGYVVAGS
jgi:hypothetical protein